MWQKSLQPCSDLGRNPARILPNHALLNTISVSESLVLSTGRIRCWLQIRRSGSQAEKIISYTYNSMISLAFISAEYAKEGTELEILWGTPGTRQMKVRAKVARFPYNQDYIRNEKRDVSDIPVFER